MIKNVRQYAVTLDAAAKFEAAIADITRFPLSGLDPILIKAELDGLTSQHQDLLDEIAEYERGHYAGH